jgi:F-type H+-transporting ATPase subunit b
MIRRWALLAAAACMCFLLLPASAQEEGSGHSGHSGEAAAEEPSMLLKVVNFGILTVGLFLIGRKAVPAMLRARTEEIQKDIAAAQQTRREADQRAAQVEARLNALGADIEAFRRQAAEEMRQEGLRIQRETEVEIKRIEEQVAQEIEAAGKTAQRELRHYAGELALKLAEQRVRARLDQSTEGALIDDFVRELEQRGARN